MKVLEKAAARFDNTRIYTHRRSRRDGRNVCGRFIWIGGIFRMGNPLLKNQQFMGIHDSLFITLNYPDYVTDILGLAADFPSLPIRLDEGKKQKDINVTWFSDVKCYVIKDKNDNDSSGIRFFVPVGIWGVTPADSLKVARTTSYLSIVKGEGGGLYHILTFPSLTRQNLRSRNILQGENYDPS